MFFDIIVDDIDFYFIFNVSIPSTLKKIDFVMHWPQCSFDFKLKTNKQKTTRALGLSQEERSVYKSPRYDQPGRYLFKCLSS